MADRGHVRAVFSVEVIGELRRRIIDHNEQTCDPAFRVKLGPLKGLYKRYFNGEHPHLHALDKIDAHLKRLRREAQGSWLVTAQPNPDEQTRVFCWRL